MRLSFLYTPAHQATNYTTLLIEACVLVLAVSFFPLKRSGCGRHDVRGQFANDFLGLGRDFQYFSFQKRIESH